MKLQDPRLEALLEAYRDDRRPTAAIREQLWQRVYEARTRRRAWVRAAVVTAVAVAALVLLWLAIRELSGEVARARDPASGSQAPFEHDAAPPRGTARAAGGRAPAAGETTAAEAAALPEPAAEPPASATATTPASEPRAAAGRASERATTSGSHAGEDATLAAPEPPPASPSDDLALVEAAEAALRAGEPKRALELLHRHEQRFPSAPTVEEREALRVLALCAAGREVEGRGARWAFLREHPRSAYRERIEKACPAP